MEKKISSAFGKKIYLLGQDKDGINYWLKEPKWDCGWYWGFGYIETYTNNKNPHLAKDINGHNHWKCLFLNGKENSYDLFKKFFTKTTLKDSEIWKLCDFMKSFYTLRETAEVLGRGHSYFTKKAKLETVKDEIMCKKINEIMLPSIFDEIKKIFQ
jgi:hypothetical protein